MGAKKKKSLANKLAKMSDEERARYLQHKADAEEEARRRKEQLIAIFMKNKIKKEDAFSRLNLAKINQEWHQILRKAKCKEMKENVGHLKGWIERVMELKRRTIDNLMIELEESEFQYSHNFQSHISQIQDIILKHQEDMSRIHEQYDDDSKEIFDIFRTETEEMQVIADGNEKHLKTVLFGLDRKMEEDLRKKRDKFINDHDDIVSSQHLELEQLSKSREVISVAIWREIARVLREYVQRTDQRRLHLAELKRLDADSAVEIAEHQERMRKAELEIHHLKKLKTATNQNHDNQLEAAKQALNSIQKTYRIVRDQLQAELKVDEKKLAFMATSSNRTLEHLKIILKKGKQILALMEICGKFESDQEKISKWLILQGEETDEKEGEMSVEIPTPDPEKAMALLRPKTSRVAARRKCSLDRSVRASDLEPIDKIVLSSKRFSPSALELQAAKLASQKRSNFLEEAFKPLFNLEGLWAVHSRVKVNLMELREEKGTLLRENEQLKELLRNVLETTVLKRSAPASRIGSGVVSRKIRGRSAPAKCF